jgi:hypothetical protein
MTKDDIIRMAREAGISKPWDQEPVKWETLERFAALVYAEGHKDGLDDFEAGVLPAAIKAELEAIAEAVSQCNPRATPKGIAAAIRAWGQG